jgi:hypothetical protein
MNLDTDDRIIDVARLQKEDDDGEGDELDEVELAEAEGGEDAE